MVAIISVKHPDPQYEGQTKTKLGNSEVRKIVSNIAGEQINRFFLENPDIAKAIVEKAEIASKARIAAKKLYRIDFSIMKKLFDSSSTFWRPQLQRRYHAEIYDQWKS